MPASIAEQGAWSFAPRPLLFAGVAALLVVNGFAPSALQEVERIGLLPALLDLFGIGAVFYFACFAMVSVASEANGTRDSRADLPIIAFGVAAALVPVHWVAKIALALVAAYLLLTSPKESASWRVGFIAATVATVFLASAILLTAFPGPVLQLDSFLVRLVTGAEGNDNLIRTMAVQGDGAIQEVVFLPGCSSIRNISQATVMFACLTQLLGSKINGRLLAACGLAILAVTASNVARISAIVLYPRYYEFLHEGAGKSIASLTSLILCMAIIGAAVVHEARKRPA